MIDVSIEEELEGSTIEEARIAAWVDGVDVRDGGMPGTPAANAEPFEIGAFVGELEDLMIFGRAVTDAEGDALAATLAGR